MIERANLLRTTIIGTAGTFSVRIGVAGVQFSLAIVLARLLGVSGYGLYSFALTIASLLTIPAALGYPGYLVKKVNELIANKEKFGVGFWLQRTLVLTIAFSSLVAAAGCMIVYLAVWPARPLLAVALFITLGGLPILVAHKLASAAVVAAGRPVAGIFVEELLRPLLLLLVLAPALFLGIYEPGYQIALILTVVSAVACLALALLLLHRWIPECTQWRRRSDRVPLKSDFNEWRHAAFPFLLATSIAYLNHEVDTLMLGIMIDTDAVGLYRPATRIVGLASFMTIAVGRVMMPIIARLHANGALHVLSKVLTTAARISFLYALIVSAILALAAPELLRLFSSEFTPAADSLRILLLGVVFAAAAPTGYHLLSMTGFQALAARVFFWSLVANISLNLTLIPLFGIEGAAIATAATAIFVTGFLGFLAFRNTRLDSSILGRSQSDVKAISRLELPASARR
jgi:O-antigen/teichoic acid export membrane protein